MHRLGCIRDKFDQRDYLMRAYLPLIKLPKKIDWIPREEGTTDFGECFKLSKEGIGLEPNGEGKIRI